MKSLRSNTVFLSLFRLVCIVITASIIAYNISLYSQDEDLTEVSYQMYNQDEEGIYPGITICVATPFRNKELEMYGARINKTTYGNFLRGRLWDDRMLRVNFDSVTMDIKDYLIEACIKQKFNGDCLNFDPEIETFFQPSKFQCFSFDNPPETNIVYVETKINASLFHNKLRPEKWEFVVRFPFPSQIFRSAKISYGEWPSRQNLFNGFTMNFYVRNVQVIRRRNKDSKPCYDWKNYDNLVMKDISEGLGCRPVYWGNRTTLPICNSMEKMGFFEQAFFDRYFGSDESESHIPPCIEPEDMRIEYSDIEAKDQQKVDEHNVDNHCRHPETFDWFKVRLWFRSNRFMEIKQIRAYNFQNLVGNGGGYIGLFLGYSMVQLPSMISSAYNWSKGFMMSKHFY